MSDEQPKREASEETPLLEEHNESAPVTDTTVPNGSEAPKNNPGILILQWLTYAFWGWTILALAYLSAMSISFFVDSGSNSYSDESTVVAYALAANLVLLIISLVCDVFYSKREPQHKTGAAMVIMIIHAVIFALCGIAAVIVAVFALVNMLINGTGPGNTTALLTGLVIAATYAATLVRVLRPTKTKKLIPGYWGLMAVIIVGMAALGIVGPAAHERMTRSDRLIESGLGVVSSEINSYTEKNDKLPSSLSDIRSSLYGDGAKLIDQNLVEYKPGKKITRDDGDVVIQVYPDPRPTAYTYELCVTYKARKGSGEIYYSRGESQVITPTTPETYMHPEGYYCYKLQTQYDYNN